MRPLGITLSYTIRVKERNRGRFDWTFTTEVCGFASLQRGYSLQGSYSRCSLPESVKFNGPFSAMKPLEQVPVGTDQKDIEKAF